MHNVATNVGEVTFIQTVRANRPKGLRKPYEYILPMQKVQELCKKLKAIEKPLQKTYQCAGLSKKAISRGIRFNLFFLAYRPGLCGKEPGVGVGKADWEAFCHKVQDLLFEYLGEDAKVYADPYSDDDKFQLRFQTYIAYSEMLGA